MILFCIDHRFRGDGISDHGKHVTIKSGENMIEQSETRIFSGNRYMSQLDLYSVRQSDIENIRRQGIMENDSFAWNIMERTFVRKALTEQMFGVIIYPEQKNDSPGAATP